MFKIGDKVEFDEGKRIGYIVKIEIDPLEEFEVKHDYVIYTVRIFRDFYLNGYTDFTRSTEDLKLYEEPIQLNLFDMMEEGK